MIFNHLFSWSTFIIYPSLFVIISLYFRKDFIEIIKTFNKTKSIKQSLFVQFDKADKDRIDTLLAIIKKYNIKTKNDIKILMEYFNNQKTIKIDSSFFGWIASFALTISSFVELVYNETTQTIEWTKIATIMGTTIGVIICVVFIYMIFYALINSVFLKKDNLHQMLSEDLAHIYFNFNHYKNQLNKK